MTSIFARVAPGVVALALVPALGVHIAPQTVPAAAASVSTSAASVVSSGYLVSDAAALKALPTSGAAWNTLLSVANADPGTPDLSNQDSVHSGRVVAAALAYARTGQVSYRTKVVAELEELRSNPRLSQARVLSVARQLAGYAIAADLVGYRDPSFVQFVSDLRTRDIGGHSRWTSIRVTSENTGNNWGAWAMASRVAASAYVGDRTDLARAAQVFRGFTGERAAYAGWQRTADFDPAWACDANAWVPINPASCGVRGGAVVEDVSRSAGTAPNVDDTGRTYSWETLGGATLTARVLQRAGYPDVWSWGDKALLRAAQFLARNAGYPAKYNVNQYIPWEIKNAYGVDVGTLNAAGHGRQFGFTDWLPMSSATTSDAAPADTQAPTVPSGVRAAAASSTRVDLSWQSSTDNVGVTGYRVKRDGTVVGTSPSLAWSDVTAVGGRDYAYSVSAVDAAGNVSAASTSVKVSTPAATSPTPVPTPTPTPTPSPTPTAPAAPVAGVAFAGATSATTPGGQATALTLPLPSVPAGAVLVATIDARGLPTITPPAGWQLVRQDSAGSAMRKATFVRVAGAGEPTSATWRFSRSTSAVGTALAYAGVSASSPVAAHGGQHNAAGTPLAAPSLTAPAGSVVIALYGVPAQVGVTPANGMVERMEVAPSTLTYKATGLAADVVRTATGATGPLVATASSSKFTTVGQTVVLRAAG